MNEKDKNLAILGKPYMREDILRKLPRWIFSQSTAFMNVRHEIICLPTGFFMLVVNINVETGGGYSFPDKFKTYYHAFDALMRFRPGSKLVERIPKSNK